MGMLTSTRPVPEDYSPLQLEHILSRQKNGEKPEAVTYGEFPVYADDVLRDAHIALHNYLVEAHALPTDKSKIKPPFV